MDISVSEQKYTAAEYLELEKQAEIKHEFYYGKLLPMAGESKKANRIITNLILFFSEYVQPKGLETFNHDVKVQVKQDAIFRYPDFVIAPQADDADAYIVRLPVLIAEVASEASWRRDYFLKRREYLEIPSLSYYVVVSQEEMFVQCHHNTKGQWQLDEFTKPEEGLSVDFIGKTLFLAEIYRNVHF
jgi:Uma2 family endonuclease